MRLEHKVAVVTGGNSGIGRAIAQEFADEGSRVAIFGRDQTSLDATRGELGGEALAVRGDVTSNADLDRLYAETTSHFGAGIDVLVANAGVGRVTPLEAIGEETFTWISEINFKGVFFTVQRAVPHLNRGASVILISSNIQRMGVPGYSVYCATKAAVRSLARTFSAELLPRGVRVNALSPGATETPFFDKVGRSKEELEEFGKFMRERIPMHRFGRPEEIAKAAVYMASDESTFMAGSEVTLDGGETTFST